MICRSITILNATIMIYQLPVFKRLLGRGDHGEIGRKWHWIRAGSCKHLYLPSTIYYKYDLPEKKHTKASLGNLIAELDNYVKMLCQSSLSPPKTTAVYRGI